MICPTCGAVAFPEGTDAVVDSSDGPLLLSRWRCAHGDWWHVVTDASPMGCAGDDEPDHAEPARGVAAYLSRMYRFAGASAPAHERDRPDEHGG